MKCKTIHKKLIFFLEEELPAKEMDLVKMHLSECSECALFAEELKKTLGVLEQEKSPKVNPFFYTRLKAKIDSLEDAKEPFWRPVLVNVLQPAFFSILLLAGIYSGISIGKPASLEITVTALQNQEMIPLLNEMENETIEGFLME